MDLFGVPQGRDGGTNPPPPPPPQLKMLYIPNNYETCHSYTLTKEDPKNI